MKFEPRQETHPLARLLCDERRHFLEPVQRRHSANLLGQTLAALAVAALMILSIPYLGKTFLIGRETLALMRAKQIGLALQLYASDHDGKYPTAMGSPAYGEGAGTAVDSNQAFANLFPAYCRTEKLFYVSGSAYCSVVAPDEVYNSQVTCLSLGENDYSYIAGLTDKSGPTLPLIVSGTDGTGHYVSDNTRCGGVWLGESAIVIHVDTSGEKARLTGPRGSRFIPRSPGDQTHNLLAPAYLSTFHARLLDPTVLRTGL